MKKHGIMMARSRLTALLCSGAALALLTACGGAGGQGSNPSAVAAQTGFAVSDAEADQRAALLVSQMTMAQKIQLVHGTGTLVLAGSTYALGYDILTPGAIPGGSGYIPGLPELGIPGLNCVDSSSGVNCAGSNSTAMPAPLALAATWDLASAQLYGARVGHELRVLGFGEGLGGGVNLASEPRGGQTFSFMGEDPVLAGEMEAARIVGTQSQGVIQTIKHFMYNEWETDRYIANVIVDEQTMREGSMLPFEIAIPKSQPGNVMPSFFAVNGVVSTANQMLLTDILKNEWGFKGTTQSDWGATLDTNDSANAGLDEEQPSQATEAELMPALMMYLNGVGAPWYIDKLGTSVTNGQVPMSRLDDMVQRKLRSMIAVGVMDNPPQPGGVIDPVAGGADSLAVSHKAMVLLQNNVAPGDSTPVLPLSSAQIKNLVVIGGHADIAVLAGAGSAGSPSAGGNPVTTCLSGGDPLFSSCASWHRSSPLAALKAKFPGANITFFDGTNPAAAASAAAAADAAIVFAYVEEGEGYDLGSLDIPSNTSGALWGTGGPDPLNPIIAAASGGNIDAGNYFYDQNALITAVAAQAKRTVVVLENASPVKMPWLSSVQGVLEAWYPGIQGGQAIADILAGDVNPSGRLPLTFPQTEADLPNPALPFPLPYLLDQGSSAAGAIPYFFKPLTAYIPAMVSGFAQALEGMGVPASLAPAQAQQIMGIDANMVMQDVTLSPLGIGYKWYDNKSIKPLFPFGYGLSYTTFSYSNPSASVDSSGNVTVSFTVTNTGSVAGDEVAQVYASLPANTPGNPQPPKRLAGWSRVSLAPGQSQTVSVTIPPKYLSTWNTTTTPHGWTLNPGAYTLAVASSAAAQPVNRITTSISF